MSNFLGFLNSGVYTGINIIKWISIAVLVFQIAVLGFTIMNSSKDGSDAITKVKEKIIPLTIGFLLVIGCGTIQKVIENTITEVNDGKTAADNKVTNTVTDKFTW